MYISGNALGTVIVFLEHPMLDVSVFMCTSVKEVLMCLYFLKPASLPRFVFSRP